MKKLITKDQVRPALVMALLLSGVQVINFATLGSLSGLGIVPRHFSGLAGIPLAPFIHHSWGHLISNLVPVCILMLLVRQSGRDIFWISSIGITLLGGICVWLFGGSGVHAGASGLIFGYWAFLLTYGWFNKTFKNLLIAFVVLVLYGGMFWSLLSFQPHVSWASHAYGALSGVFMAWSLKNKNISK